MYQLNLRPDIEGVQNPAPKHVDIPIDRAIERILIICEEKKTVGSGLRSQ